MRRPLEGSYWTTFAIVMIALCPNIVLTTAWPLLTKPIGHAVGLGPTGLAVTEGLSNAGYAFGALVGGDLTQRFPQRPLHLACQALFAAGSVLAALAPGVVSFSAGRVLQGLATGFLLVVAIPPLVQRFPHTRMRTTAAGVNVGFFGAVCAGPLVGGISATGGSDFRFLFGGLALVGATGVALALLSLPDAEPPNPDLRPDVPALALAGIGTIAPFVGVALLTATRYTAPSWWAPLAGGSAALVALLVLEYRKREALAPVRPLASTLALLGVLVATLAGAVFVTGLELTLAYLTEVRRWSPVRAGIATWPELAAIALAALAFYLILRTRWLAALVFAGFAALAGGVGVLLLLGRAPAGATVLGATALLGFGAGATVSPALWLAGFTVPAKLVGRVFALVELLRAEGDYIMGPILRKVSQTSAGALGATHGIRHALWLTLWIAVASIALCAAVLLLGKVRPQRPDLVRYVEEGEPGLETTRLLHGVRS